MTMYVARPSQCRYCPALVIWTENERTHKAAPVDAEPAENGNVKLTARAHGLKPLSQVLAGEPLDEARLATEPLHLNHFATCKNPPPRRPPPRRR